MTKREMYMELLGIVTEQRHIDFINHELELLNKKNSGRKGLTATQKQNNDIKLIILDAMEVGKVYTVTEIQNIVDYPEVAISFNKMSSLVTQLKKAGLIERIEVKGKPFFRKV